ncbi:MAG: SRPBCC family protein [Candidatus Dormibacteria bacterium]
MTDVIEVTVHIAAPRETVFAYFTDPSRYLEWMGSDATLDPVPGGAYRVHMRDGVEARGEFVALEPPHRVEFTWGWAGDNEVPPGSSRVVVTLTVEDGGTRVVLRHHGLPSDQQREHHRQGWLLHLSRLVTRASGGTSQARSERDSNPRDE